MTDIINLTEFVAGTKAKADEVNENFSNLKDYVLTRANSAGDETKNFKVADGVETHHAVSKSQLDSLKSTMESGISKNTKRCYLKSGAVYSSGVANVLSFSEATLTVGEHTAVDIEGKELEIEQYTVDCSTYSNGTYVLYEDEENHELLVSKITRGNVAPTSPTENDVWINLGLAPISEKKYYGEVWEDYSKVPIGEVVIASNIITSVKTFDFNQNGYEVNSQTQGYRMPDYAKCVQGVTAAEVWKTVDKDSLVVVSTVDNSSWSYVALKLKDENGNFITSAEDPDNEALKDGCIDYDNPRSGIASCLSANVPRGYSYSIKLVQATLKKCLEYPLKGAN